MTEQSDSDGTTRLRRSLQLRVAFLLGLSLLPLGLIALVQTWNVIKASEDALDAALLARTSELVAPEREAIFIGIGHSRGLADSVAALFPAGAACTALMRRAVASSNRVEFAGVFSKPDRTECNSTGEPLAISVSPHVEDAFASREPLVSFDPRGHVTGRPTIVVSEPIRNAQGAFLGFVSTSLRVERIGGTLGRERGLSGTIITFNHLGNALTHEGTEGIDDRDLDSFLPRDRPLTGLAKMRSASFIGTDRQGRRRHFTLVPIVDGRAYALGSWPAEGIAAGSHFSAVFVALLFPFLMWIVSIGVAVASVNRLVLRHIRDLGRRMRVFAGTRRIFPARHIEKAPTELRDIDATFERMAQKILRDEAELEDALYERGVLMKEVHHRVKNNLQQISSIISMQIRETDSDEVRQVLGQFRDRVLGLASVYRALYQEPSVAHVRADRLLDQMLSQLITSGAGTQGSLRVERDLQPVRLEPDQASALAMLAAEALVHAVTHGQPANDGAMHLSVRLCHEDPRPDGQDGPVCLIVGNSASRENAEPAAGQAAATSLGKRLIAAFAQQLDTRADYLRDAGKLQIRVCFEPKLT